VSVMTLRTVLLLGVLLLAVGLSAQVTMIRALTLYDSGNPSADEQLVLEYINRARANPTAEGTRLGINMWEGLCDVNDVGVRPPLAMNKILHDIAWYHSWDMYTNNYFSHTDLSGNGPSQRMTNAGYNWNWWGENIAWGSGGYSATDLEDILMVDSGLACRGHRVNLFSSNFKEVGVGYYAGATRNLVTQDFGSTSVGPFLVGVVYNDADGDNFYDIGEGISGVTITPSAGSYYAVSSTSGGYAFPIGTSGTITVTASGSGLLPITKTVSLSGANIKLDFTPQMWSAVPTGSTDASPAIAFFNNRLYAAVKGQGSSSVYLNSMGLAAGVWSGWQVQPGSTPSSPALTASSTHLYIVARGSDNKIYWRRMTTGSSWTSWQAVPSGSTDAAPSVAFFNNRVYVAAKGLGSNSIYVNSMDAGTLGWSGWAKLSGATPYRPALAASSNYLYIVVTGTNNLIYWRRMTAGGSWSASWTMTPSGSTDTAPSAAFLSGLYVTVKGKGSASIYLNSMDEGTLSWSGWAKKSGSTSNSPSLAAYGYVYIAVRGLDNKIYWRRIN